MPHQLIASALQRLAAPGSKLLLAVSGGADSIALLRLVAGTDWPAEVAAVDHGLRPEAAEEVEFVRHTAEHLGLKFHSAAFATRAVADHRGWNLEETARTLRYQHLAAIARANGADHIVTAHTMDDQTETVLMQLLRGAAWLTGMPERTGLVIRPLLGIRKQELSDWLRHIGQDWREDPSNFDTDFRRAWLRTIILPPLRERQPDLDQRIAGLTRLQRQQKEFLDAQARPYVDVTGGIEAARLAGKARALQQAAVAHLLKAHGVPLDLERLDRIIAALKQAENWRESTGPDSLIRLYDGRLEVIGQAEPEAVSNSPVSGAEQLPAGVAEAALELPGLVLRSRQPGDRIRLAAGSRKLSDVLIDAKVPREERDAVRVLASGSDVIWVDGIAVATEYASGPAQPDDRHFMRLALELAREAAAAGELPVGAVIVRNGQVLASARNETEARSDPTAHAELLAVQRAAETVADWRLTDCSLYVTLEPCAMCFGAMQQAHLDTVVFAAANHREGATGSVADLDLLPWKRKLQVRRGPYAKEAGELLSDFFRNRRDAFS